MRAPEPRPSAVIPVPHCPNVTVPRVHYRLFKDGGAHTPSYPNSVAITRHGRICRCPSAACIRKSPPLHAAPTSYRVVVDMRVPIHAMFRTRRGPSGRWLPPAPNLFLAFASAPSVRNERHDRMDKKNDHSRKHGQRDSLIDASAAKDCDAFHSFPPSRRQCESRRAVTLHCFGERGVKGCAAGSFRCRRTGRHCFVDLLERRQPSSPWSRAKSPTLTSDAASPFCLPSLVPLRGERSRLRHCTPRVPKGRGERQARGRKFSQ